MKIQIIARHKGKTVETTITDEVGLIERLVYANEATKALGIPDQLANFNKSSAIKFIEDRGGRRCSVTARRFA